jgi:hypothetical protein
LSFPSRDSIRRIVASRHWKQFPGSVFLSNTMARILNHILLAAMAMILVVSSGSGYEWDSSSDYYDGSEKLSSDSGQGVGITIIISSLGGSSEKQIWNQAKATSGAVHQVRSDRYSDIPWNSSADV